MDGIFIKGMRPKSKKAIKEAVADNPDSVRIECTSLFPGGYDGSVADLPEGKSVTFVGPDPYTSRKFYGTIKRTSTGIKVT